MKRRGKTIAIRLVPAWATALLLTIFFARPSSLSAAQGTSEEVLARLAESLLKIEDLSTTLTKVLNGSEGTERIDNYIKMFKIFAKRGICSAERAETEIKSWTAVRERTVRYEYDNESESSEWLLHQSGMYKVTFRAPDGSSRTVVSYDGDSHREYQGGNMRRGFILPDDSSRPKHTPRFALTSRDGRPLLEFFQRAAELDRLTVSTDDGGIVEVVATLPPDRDGHAEQRTKAWLDPSRGYMPVRVEHGEFAGEYFPGQILDNIELRELSPGIWFPVAARMQAFASYNVADSEKPVAEWASKSCPIPLYTSYRCDDIKINTGLTKDDFSFEFPDSTVISDQTKVGWFGWFKFTKNGWFKFEAERPRTVWIIVLSVAMACLACAIGGYRYLSIARRNEVKANAERTPPVDPSSNAD